MTADKELLSKLQHDVNSLRQDFKNHQVITNEQQIVANHKIDDTINKIDKVNENIDEIKSNQQKILLFIQGDGIDPKSGIVKRVSTIEEFIDGIKSTKSYINGNIAAVIFIISLMGAIISLILNVISYFKK